MSRSELCLMGVTVRFYKAGEQVGEDEGQLWWKNFEKTTRELTEDERQALNWYNEEQKDCLFVLTEENAALSFTHMGSCCGGQDLITETALETELVDRGIEQALRDDLPTLILEARQQLAPHTPTDKLCGFPAPRRRSGDSVSQLITLWQWESWQDHTGEWDSDYTLKGLVCLPQLLKLNAALLPVVPAERAEQLLEEMAKAQKEAVCAKDNSHSCQDPCPDCQCGR